MLIFLSISSCRTAECPAVPNFRPPAGFLRMRFVVSLTMFESGTRTRGEVAVNGECGQTTFRHETTKTIRSAKTRSGTTAKRESDPTGVRQKVGQEPRCELAWKLLAAQRGCRSPGSVARLHRLCRIPQDRRVYTLGINREHLVVQVERGLGMGSNPVEIANIFSCRLDVVGCIGSTRPLVSGNSGHWLERLDRIERRNPLVAAFRIRLAQMKMNIVVESITADGQPDRRDVETGCAIGIGMPERNTSELFPFEFESAALEFVRDRER